MNNVATALLIGCGALVTVAGAVTVLWWLVAPRVKAWAEEQIIGPLRQTHHQVTVNHHSSKEPTILDRLDTLTTAVEAQGREFESMQQNVSDLTGVVVQHLNARTD